MPNIPALTDYTHDPEMHNNAWQVHYPDYAAYIGDVLDLGLAWAGERNTKGTASGFTAYVDTMQSIAMVAWDGEFGDYVDKVPFDGWQRERAIDRIDRDYLRA